jgi:transcriptional regulator with XRE-family HTH domain
MAKREDVLNLKMLKERRQELGLTMEQAAQKAGLSSKGHWSDIESGRKSAITVGTLVSIAKALDVDVQELLK